MSFSPGELTAREVAQLREMLRAKEAFTRLSVSPPLNLTRAAGIPNIGIDLSQNPGEVLIAEVDSSTGTPPVHTVTVQTRNTSNALIDSTPTQTITQVLNFRAISTAIPNGSIVEIFPIPGSVGWWWADYTAASTITVKEQDGTPSYSSISTVQFDQADGFVVSNPSAGVAQVDIADASATQAGKVNTTTQTYAGLKTFNDNVVVRNVLARGMDSGTTYGTGTFASNTLASRSTGDTTYAPLAASYLYAFDTVYAIGSIVAGAAGGSGVFYSGTSAGASGSFTTADAKTVTVTGGIITSIV